MIIEPINKLFVESGNNLILANKARIRSIKETINNKRMYDECFNMLEKELIGSNTSSITNILSENIFYENVEDEFSFKVLNTYKSCIDKVDFINKLKESYSIRGVKGVCFAWTPIIERFYCN